MSDDWYDDHLCSICGHPRYRHPIVIWALICLRCDRPSKR